ncbi:hypothetical protein PMAYCL1PPCAC_18557, partial [Pristionchus mayeri]
GGSPLLLSPSIKMTDRSLKKTKKRSSVNTKKTDSVMGDVVSSRSAARQKRSKSMPKTSNKTSTKKERKREEAGKSPKEAESGRRSEYALRNPDLPSAVQLNDLRQYVKEVIEKGVNGLLEEYESIKKYNIDPMKNVNHLANPTKNRYRDIYCIDPTRVILEGENNYIHANNVKGDPFINDFICTQAPLESTIEDFWKMIAQENVGYVIMLCDLVELGKKKCEKYIPENVFEEKTYGEIKVKLLECNSIDPQFIMSHLLMEAPGTNSRVIFHYQWREWPDHGVPVTTNAALRALSAIRGSTFTAIVHCSAGVGRTGTLVAVEWVLQTIMKGERVDMKKTLREMRNQRGHAIQTNMQYVYIAQCALRLWTKVDKEKLDPNLSNEDVFLKFTADMKAANPQAYNPK